MTLGFCWPNSFGLCLAISGKSPVVGNSFLQKSHFPLRLIMERYSSQRLKYLKYFRVVRVLAVIVEMLVRGPGRNHGANCLCQRIILLCDL